MLATLPKSINPKHRHDACSGDKCTDTCAVKYMINVGAYILTLSTKWGVTACMEIAEYGEQQTCDFSEWPENEFLLAYMLH